MNRTLLKAALRAKNVSMETAAAKIGLNLATFFAKTNQIGGAEFSLGEIRQLKALLGLSAPAVDAIFFETEVSYKDTIERSTP